MHQKFPQSSMALRVFATLVACFFFTGTAMAQDAKAQEKTSSIAPPSQTGTVASGSNSGTSPMDSAGRKAKPEIPLESATPPAKSNDSPALASGNTLGDYKKSLADLQALYEQEVQKREQQNTQLKGLFSDGLVARVEVEKSDKDLADARAKVEETRNQLAAANKPVPLVPDASVNLISNTAWSTGNNRVDTLVRFYGNKYGVDPYLIYCLMSQESKFQTIATSPKGAQGLMQLMPGTAARYGVTNPYDMAQSISGGTHYLKDLLQMFNGRIDLALAGYNAGENAVIKHGYKVPPYEETRNYVRLITARYAMKPAS